MQVKEPYPSDLTESAYSMDFSAWFEVFLEERWWTFDARHNQRRVERVLMATGRDAVDVALTTIFGPNRLTGFRVYTHEINNESPTLFPSGKGRNIRTSNDCPQFASTMNR